jgi:MoxR-like ATPase
MQPPQQTDVLTRPQGRNNRKGDSIMRQSNIFFDTTAATPTQAMKLWKRAKENEATAGPWSQSGVWTQVITRISKDEAAEALAAPLADFEAWVAGLGNGLEDYSTKQAAAEPKPEPKPEPKRKKKRASKKKADTPVDIDNILKDQGALVSELSNYLAPGIIERINKQFELAKEAAKPQAAPVLPNWTPKTEGYVKPAEYDAIASLVKAKIPVLMVGPAGSGKSRMGREIAKEMNVTYSVFSFSGGIRYAQAYIRTRLVNGDTVDELSPLLQSIQQPGVIHIEEIFSADPEVLIGLNSLLEDGELMTPAGLVKVHEDCSIMASANTNGRSVSRQYTGAKRVDDSTLNRWSQIDVDYSAEVEAGLVKALENEEQEKFLLNSLATLRQELKRNQIDFHASTRGLVKVLTLVKRAGWSAEQAFLTQFITPLTAAEKAKVAALTTGIEERIKQ